MRQLPRGFLIAIEGIDGAGKTTQTAAVREKLTALGFTVIASKEPTTGPWGQKIRDSATTQRMPLEDELAAFLEDRKQHVAELISPALANGTIVIVDRYYFSNAAYQGAAGVDPEKIIRDNEAFAPRPDLLIMLDVPVDVGLERIRTRGDNPNLFERRDALERCKAIFETFEGPWTLRLDGMEAVDVVTARILRAIHDGPLFKAMCLKVHYKPECEPEHCSLRSACGYLETGSLSPTVAPPWLSVLDDESKTDEEKIDALVTTARAERNGTG
ncbi:MAG TPA: dTMP kinase [Polyangiaceae bacterium]|nr:dTMP kinase [Polyangiaceae bacterium]